MEQRGSITCAFICERIALNMLYPAFRTCMAHSHLDQNRWNFEVTFFHIERYGQSIELRKVDRPIIKPFSDFHHLSDVFFWTIKKKHKLTMWSTKFYFWMVCFNAAEIWYNYYNTIFRSTKDNKVWILHTFSLIFH